MKGFALNIVLKQQIGAWIQILYFKTQVGNEIPFHYKIGKAHELFKLFYSMSFFLCQTMKEFKGTSLASVKVLELR